MYSQSHKLFAPIAGIFDDLFVADQGPATRWVGDKVGTAVLEIALPGYQKSDVSVSVEADVVSVAGKAKGFVTADFEKSWKLGDYRMTGATMADGVLSLHFTRNKPKTERVEVTIE